MATRGLPSANGSENMNSKLIASAGVALGLVMPSAVLAQDTLATVKPVNATRQSDYQADYAALRDLHGLANDLGIGIVAVHHVRKAEADDPFDTVSGSTGLTGAADTTLILTKRTEDGGCVLYGRGRDLHHRVRRTRPEKSL